MTKTKTLFLKSKHRGVNDIITTLMLLAITIAGASTLTYFVNDTFLNGSAQAANEKTVHLKFVTLTGYDSRDSQKLFQLNLLSNKFDSKICASSCASKPNDIPTNGGTEFLVLRLENNSVGSAFLSNVYVNGYDHQWDSSTANKQLDATQKVSGKYPSDGRFSILPKSGSTVQKSSNVIESGEEVIVLVKLGNEPDILLSKGIRLSLNIGDPQLTDFVITSGEAQ